MMSKSTGIVVGTRVGKGVLVGAEVGTVDGVDVAGTRVAMAVAVAVAVGAWG